MPSIKKNFFYNGLLTVANYLFPLITYPYVSRVLGVSNIGICNFVDSIVNYFILFSMMGVAIVGVREIAAVREDREARNRVFSDLIALNCLTSGLAAVALVAALFVVPALAEYRSLLWIGVVKILANFLCMDWLFQGMEEFKYITNRTIFVKFLYVAGVFLLVRKPEDYPVYYLLLTLMVVLNAGINLSYARRFVSFRKQEVDLARHVRPFLTMGLYMFLTSMYTTFNVTYLGFISDSVQVGYYTSATKVFSMVIALFTAFTTVMLPRMSAVLSEGRKDEFLELVSKTFRILFIVGVPVILLLLVGAGDVIRILSGKGYEGAVAPMRIVAPLILIIGMEQILVVQVMMPMKMDRAVFVNSAVGAGVGVLLNLLLVRFMLAQGSAIVWMVSELSVFMCAWIVVSRSLSLHFPLGDLMRVIVFHLPLVPLLILFLPIGNAFLRLGCQGVVTGLYMLAVNLLFFKDGALAVWIRSMWLKVFAR